MASEAMDCASSPMAVLKSEPQDPGVSRHHHALHDACRALSLELLNEAAGMWSVQGIHLVTASG